MDNLLIFRVVLSFVIAGVWIAGATLLAEKFGSRIGGLITNLPSNILISLLFIAMVNDVTFVVHAIPGIPIGMAINTIFLVVFILLVDRGLLFAVFISLLIWFIIALLATILKLDSLIYNVIIYLIITVILFILIEKYKQIPSVDKITKKYSTGQIIVRAVFAGGIVATIIVISQIFNPYIVGIFSTFPAVLLSTMVILVLNQNARFA